MPVSERGRRVGQGGGAAVHRVVAAVAGDRQVVQIPHAGDQGQQPVRQHRPVGIAPAPCGGIGAVAGGKPVQRPVQAVRQHGGTAFLRRGGQRILQKTGALPQPFAEQGAEVAGEQRPRQFPLPRGKDQRLGPGAVHAVVPACQHRHRLGRPRAARGNRQHQRQQVVGSGGAHVLLLCRHSVGGDGAGGVQHRRDPAGAQRLRPFGGNQVGIARPDHGVVGVDQPPRRRVFHLWQVGEGDHAGPVVFPGPAGNRHPPVAVAPHRHPPRRDQADGAVGGGIGHVLLRRLVERQGGAHLRPRSGAVQAVQRLDRGVRLPQPGEGQGQHLAGGCQIPPFQIRQHRPVTGFAHGQRLRRPAGHGDGFRAGDEGRAAVGGEVAGRVGGVDAFDEQILGVAVGHGEAPRHPPVVAQQMEGHPRRRRPAEAQARRLDPGQIPQDRRFQLQMGVVGQDRLAGGGVAPVQHPFVGRQPQPRRLRRQGGGQCGQPFRGDAVQGGQGGGRIGPGRGKQRLHPFRRQTGQQAGAVDFPAVVGGQAQRHQLGPHHAVGRAPGFRRQPQKLEFQGQRLPPVGQIGVDPGGIGIECCAGVGGQGGHAGRRPAVQPQRAHQPVGAQHGILPAQNLAQPPGPGAAGHLHLPQPVLGVQIPQRGIGVMGTGGVNVGNAVAVADHGHRLVQAGQGGVTPRIGNLGAQPAPRRHTGQQRHRHHRHDSHRHPPEPAHGSPRICCPLQMGGRGWGRQGRLSALDTIQMNADINKKLFC